MTSTNVDFVTDLLLVDSALTIKWKKSITSKDEYVQNGLNFTTFEQGTNCDASEWGQKVSPQNFSLVCYFEI